MPETKFLESGARSSGAAMWTFPWSRGCGTYVVLRPYHGTELWYVGDWRNPNKTFGEALPLEAAQQEAEHLVRMDHDLIEPIPRPFG